MLDGSREKHARQTGAWCLVLSLSKRSRLPTTWSPNLRVMGVPGWSSRASFAEGRIRASERRERRSVLEEGRKGSTSHLAANNA